MKWFLHIFGVALLSSILAACFDSGGGGSSTPDLYYWDNMGSMGEGSHTTTAIVIDPLDNSPIVTFRDIQNGGKPHVLKWAGGTSWTSLGYLSPFDASWPSLALDPADNKPVAVFSDNSYSARARVKKWDAGTTWIDLGFASSGDTLGGSGWHRPPSIAIDPSDNAPVVAFADGDNGWRIQVKKWAGGTSWTDLGYPSPGVGYFPILVFDPTDYKPVVAFVDVDNGRRPRVMKWSSGTSWTDLGFASAGITAQTTIAIGTDGMPVVVFVEDYYDPGIYTDTPLQAMKIQAAKYTGTEWSNLGRLTQHMGDSPSIVIDPTDNKPIVSFRDWASPDAPTGNGLHVKKWDSGTTWIGKGFPSSTLSAYSSITIDPSDNKPVVFYSERVDGISPVRVSKHP